MIECGKTLTESPTASVLHSCPNFCWGIGEQVKSKGKKEGKPKVSEKKHRPKTRVLKEKMAPGYSLSPSANKEREKEKRDKKEKEIKGGLLLFYITCYFLSLCLCELFIFKKPKTKDKEEKKNKKKTEKKKEEREKERIYFPIFYFFQLSRLFSKKGTKEKN